MHGAALESDEKRGETEETRVFRSIRPVESTRRAHLIEPGAGPRWGPRGPLSSASLGSARGAWRRGAEQVCADDRREPLHSGDAARAPARRRRRALDPDDAAEGALARGVRGRRRRRREGRRGEARRSELRPLPLRRDAPRRRRRRAPRAAARRQERHARHHDERPRDHRRRRARRAARRARLPREAAQHRRAPHRRRHRAAPDARRGRGARLCGARPGSTGRSRRREPAP